MAASCFRWLICRILLGFIFLCKGCIYSAVDQLHLQQAAASDALLKLSSIGDLTSCTRSCRSCMNLSSPKLISRKFFFMHIPKTGGLSVEMDLRRLVCDGVSSVKNQCFCGRNQSQFQDLSLNKFRYKINPNLNFGWKDYMVFSGHRYWGMVPDFMESANPVVATLLREPLSRAISHWNMIGGRSLGFNNSLNMTFSDAVRSSINSFGKQVTVAHVFGSAIRNEQVLYACGIYCEESLPLTDALKRAKQNLLRTAVVGIREDMDGFLEQLRAVLPWWPPEDQFKRISQLNTANDVVNIVRRRHHRQTSLPSMDPEAVALLNDFLWAEHELYAFAVDLSALKSKWARSCAAYAALRGCFSFISDCH